MNRRDFLKSALTVAALAPITRLSAGAGPDGGKLPDDADAVQVTRRRYKDTALTLPLLGFGCMRLPLTAPGGSEIDHATVRKMVERAMRAGCNYFDTAYMYHNGESEKCMGRILSEYDRDSYCLADKMPMWIAGNAAGVERIFKEQLARCRVDYFDFYLLHSLNRSHWDMAGKHHALDFLRRMKAEGRIRKLGFSFHDSPELLRTVVDAGEWDFAQIQLNYLDWELYRSREQYEILTRAGIPVIVMEPLRGGTLAALSPEAANILKTADSGASVASWAFRYVASLPNVLCVLSGMSLPEHLEDNIKTFSPLKPLSDAERETLDRALAAYRGNLTVPCTACRYCMPCPVGVEIPKIFGLYNQYKLTGNRWQFRGAYDTIPEDSRASACVNCGRCAKHCPQKIDIPGMMRKIAKEAE